MIQSCLRLDQKIRSCFIFHPSFPLTPKVIFSLYSNCRGFLCPVFNIDPAMTHWTLKDCGAGAWGSAEGFPTLTSLPAVVGASGHSASWLHISKGPALVGALEFWWALPWASPGHLNWAPCVLSSMFFQISPPSLPRYNWVYVFLSQLWLFDLFIY